VLYHKCCKRYHDGELPETAEQLMRSRYAAYSMSNADYVMDTTHPQNSSYTTDREAWKKDILRFCTVTKFNGLRIVDRSDEADASFVTFAAELAQMKKDVSFTERSKFLKVDGRWLYHSAEILEEK
jgi:SEC-C motif domain protein